MSIEILPDEMIINIMFMTNGASIFQFLMCSKNLFNLLSNTHFWNEKIVSEFPQFKSKLAPSLQTYKWFAWISQQTEKYNNVISVSNYGYSEAFKIYILDSIINIGPKVLVKPHMINNIIVLSTYKMNENVITDVHDRVYTAFYHKYFEQIAMNCG